MRNVSPGEVIKDPKRFSSEFGDKFAIHLWFR